MPTATTLSRISRYDYFAILGSGTYVVGCACFLGAAIYNSSTKPSAQATASWLSGEIEQHWPIAVGLLFLAFLVGNALRAMPVNTADKWGLRWFNFLTEIRHSKENEPPQEAKEYREALHSALHKDEFPYPKMLELELKALKLALKNSTWPADLVIPPEKTRHSMFNFWKAEICRESAASFEFTQELEGRVRLFATMFWAALLGTLVGFVTISLCAFGSLGTGWKMVALVMSALSALICFVFGSQLRRVRGQEVSHVFIAYLSLQLAKSNPTKQESGVESKISLKNQ